jgi:diadenosine tetraphosphate (Ap4A) HIT family hydrolase
VPAFYDLDLQEQRQLWDAIADLRLRIAATIVVSGFDAGFVDAPRGEEDNFHTYVHLVPRINNHRNALPAGPEWVDLG